MRTLFKMRNTFRIYRECDHKTIQRSRYGLCKGLCIYGHGNEVKNERTSVKPKINHSIAVAKQNER